MNTIEFRLIKSEEDIRAVATLVKSRGHKKSVNEIYENIKRELEDNHIEKLKIFVALFENKVIGFCRLRFFERGDFPDTQNAPMGWYLMGIIVFDSYRRNKVGTRLSQLAIDNVKKSNDIYVIINKENKASINMHKQLGFEIIQEGSIFLNVSFSGGCGYLLKRDKDE